MILAIFMPETRGESLEKIQEAFHRTRPKSWVSGASLRIRNRKQGKQGGHGMPAVTGSRVELESL